MEADFKSDDEGLPSGPAHNTTPTPGISQTLSQL